MSSIVSETVHDHRYIIQGTVEGSHAVLLSLCFNGHFPGGPGLGDIRMSPFWTLLELRTMNVVVTVGVVSQIVTTSKPTPNFVQAGCPSCCQPKLSEHWRRRVRNHMLFYCHHCSLQWCLLNVTHYLVMNAWTCPGVTLDFFYCTGAILAGCPSRRHHDS